MKADDVITVDEFLSWAGLIMAFLISLFFGVTVTLAGVWFVAKLYGFLFI